MLEAKVNNKKARAWRPILLACMGLLLPARRAAASDFSIFMTIFWSLYALAAVVIGVMGWLVTRKSRSAWLRATVWGFFAPLVLLPISTTGGNGSGVGPPLLNFIMVALGADPAYAIQSVVPLLAGTIVASAVLFAVFREALARRGGDPELD